MPAIEGICPKRKRMLKDVLLEMCTRAPFPAHITNFFSYCFRDPLLHEMEKHFRYHSGQKSGKGESIQQTEKLDICRLLNVVCD